MFITNTLSEFYYYARAGGRINCDFERNFFLARAQGTLKGVIATFKGGITKKIVNSTHCIITFVNNTKEQQVFRATKLNFTGEETLI